MKLHRVPYTNVRGTKRVATTGRQPGDPTPEEIARLKRLIREEKGEADPIPAPEIVDWTTITHLLSLDVDDGE